MKTRIINTNKAPKAIGPYSQAIIAGDLMFLSGQIPLDPDTMELVNGGIKEQTVRVLENINEVLNEAGIDFNHVVKTTVYLKDMGNFAEMNEVYAQYFNNNKPARACVEVARLPKDVAVEIEVIAAL